MGRKAILLLAVVLATGCGADSENDFETPVVSIPTAQVTTKIVGATPKQETILREILAGLGASPLESVEVVHDVGKAWGAPRNAVGLDVQPRKADVYGTFHGELVGQTFVRRSFQLGLAPIAYIGVSGDSSAGVYDPAEELSEPTLTVSEARAQAQRVRKLAESHGAAVRRLELLKPDRLAFVIELQTNEAAEFLLNGLDAVLEPIDLGRHRGFDGMYLKVFDTEGKPVLETGGGSWVRKDLISCSPYHTFRLGFPDDPEPPPCPAEREQQRDAPVPVAAPPRSDSTTKIVGASPKQESVLRELLAGLGPTKLRSITIKSAGNEWKAAPPGSVGIRLEGADEEIVSIWHGWLVADAFDERSQELGLPPLAYTATGPDPGGESGAGSDDGQEERQFMTVDTAQSIAQNLRSVFRAHGAEVRHIEIVHPKRPAFVIELEADDPAAFLLFDFHAVLSPPDAGLDGGLGGVHVRIVDAEGELVFEWATAAVAGGTSSTHWIRPDLRGCNPLFVGGPPGQVTPPCPAADQSPVRQ